MLDNYEILRQKLDVFIRKYYKNQIIKGSIYTCATALILFLIFIFFEYISYTQSVIRAILFYSFIFVLVFLVIRFIILPWLKLNKIGNIISYEFAAEIIGKHFNHIGDKLLNTIQLHSLKNLQQHNIDLLNAGIEQRITDLKPIPFTMAINFKANRKYLKFVLIPLSIFVLILMFSPDVITGPTARILQYNKHFEKPAPFTIEINNKLTVIENEDLALDIEISGNELPNELFIRTSDNIKFKLNKKNKTHFTYILKNVKSSFKFEIINDYFISKTFQVTVLPRPVLIGFQIDLNYPEHTKKKDETLHNIGDFTVPEGTHIKWQFLIKKTDIVHLFINKLTNILRPEKRPHRIKLR